MVVREVRGQQPFWNGSLGHVHKGISPLTSLNFPLTSLNSLGEIFPQDIWLSLRVFVFQVISVKNVHFLCGIRKKYYFCNCFLKKRKIGRVTECAGLEIRYTLFRVSGVWIPHLPQTYGETIMKKLIISILLFLPLMSVQAQSVLTPQQQLEEAQKKLE